MGVSLGEGRSVFWEDKHFTLKLPRKLPQLEVSVCISASVTFIFYLGVWVSKEKERERIGKDLKFWSHVTTGEVNSDFCLQYPSTNCNSSNKMRAWKNKHLGLRKSNVFVSGQGLNVQLSVSREKHVNTLSFHQPLMDVLIFAGQHGSPWQCTKITYLRGSWLL